MHAAGERAAGLDGGDAVVTTAGRAVTTDTVVRAAGVAAIAITASGGCTPRATRAMARGSAQKIAEEV